MHTNNPNTTTQAELPQGTTTISISDNANNKNFDSFGLSIGLVKGIYRYGWEHPSPIQEMAIPAFIKSVTRTDDDSNTKDKKDIIAQAQSGTGKTGAFLIGTLHNLDLSTLGTQAIIISPTRELATQTHDVCSSLSKYLIDSKSQTHISHLFIGGSYRRDDISKFRKDVKVAIGTPGRLIDMIKSKHLNVSTVKMLILDEADDLLSDGFAEQIHDIFSHLPKSIQVGLFSATMPNEVLILTNKFMREPIRFLKERDELSLKGISQYQVSIPSDEGSSDEIKLSIVDDIYSKMSIAQAVIFCNTRKKVEFLAQQLKNKGFSIITMHSDMPEQEKRRVMKAFREGDNRILAATDVMARGIDIQHVSIVVNFDIPNNKENFLHRSGRAGRYGRRGVTINLVNEKEAELIKNIEEYYSIDIGNLPSDFDKHLSSD